MSDRQPPSPMPMGIEMSPGGTGTDLGVIEELARTVRRMRADESFDANGFRTVWHRGRQNVELLSWENEDKQITKQELSMLGMVIEFNQGKPLRTGTVPTHTEGAAGAAASHLVTMDERPKPRSLILASHLLKHIQGRDFYAQHLLKEVNDAIVSFGFDDARTAVSSLSNFSRRETITKTQTLDPRVGATTRRLQVLRIVLAVLGLAAVGLALGLGVGFAMGLM